MESINLCLKAVAKPGDAIAVESPVFYGFLQILESLGMKALEIPTHPRDGISVTSPTPTAKRCGIGFQFHNWIFLRRNGYGSFPGRHSVLQRTLPNDRRRAESSSSVTLHRLTP